MPFAKITIYLINYNPGVRYLDFRVGKNSKNEPLIIHGFINCENGLLKDVL